MGTPLLILPNFVLILIGLALGRLPAFGRDFWEGLEKLVYYVLFPALLLRSLAVGRIELAAAAPAIGTAAAFTLAGFVLSIAAGPVLRLDRKLVAATSQCGYRFNTYIGLALAGSLFGTPGVAFTALVLGTMIPVVNVLAVTMLARHGERGLARELATNPLLVSTAAGFAWNALGLPVPGFADQTLALLAQASLPAGLLCVGAAMRIEKAGAPLAAHAWWLAVKLLAVPLVAWLAIRALAIPAPDAVILIICAALPCASSAYILAVRMAGDARAAAAQITAGTLVSMVSLPVWVALVGR